MPLKFTRPDIYDSPKKPLAIANKKFPYPDLADHRRFEELLYVIGSERIKNGDWRGIFDDIRLLQGVRERGRDCIMTLKGNNIALIQCKHTSVSERVSASSVAREIIKFVLHSIVDPNLIYNKEHFTYFFAVAFGFMENAADLIDNFNDQILDHPKLEAWTSKIISANSSLGHLKYDEVCDELKDTLGRISVKPITPQDLDNLLLKDGSESIIKAFFEVRSVVDPKVTDLILGDLKDLRNHSEYHSTSKLPVAIILKKIELASHHLYSYNNSFEGIQNSHLDRDETSQIVTWIKDAVPGNQEPIAVLSGNAGSGKTVVLQDVYKRLKADDIPVIGLKADKYTAQSIKELEEKLNLEDSFEKIIRKLSSHNERVVVIIDQIDALSQSLSARRDYLNTFNHLVRSLSSIDKIRIVISARIYDLNYDNELKFYTNQKVFNLGLLKPNQVNQILTHLGIKKASLSKVVYELLKTPHHLNVLCKIHNQGVNLTSLKSRYDLHEQLWTSKVLRAPKSSSANNEKCQELLYLMARQMHDNQEIFITVTSLTDQYLDELDYLKSVEIVTQVDSKIQFFHQTFYDFTFARQFVHSNQSVIAYLKQNHQGLFIRSSLKMILQFLRDYDHPKYIKTISKILFSLSYRFHLKLMVINLVGFESEPTKFEIDLVQSRVFKSSSMKRLFIESAFGEVWLQTMIDSGLLTELLLPKEIWYDNFLNKDFRGGNILKEKLTNWTNYKTPETRQEEYRQLVFQTLVRQLPDSGKLVCNFLRRSPNFKDKPRFIFRLLYYVKEWDNEDAVWLFEDNEAVAEKDRFGYYKVLEDAAKYRIDWVLFIYKKLCFQKIDTPSEPLSTKDIFEHSDEELFKKLFATNPSKAFDFTLEVIQKLINEHSWIDRTKLYGDSVYMWYSYEKGSSYSNEFLLNLLIDQLRVFAQKRHAKFIEFYRGFSNHNSTSLLVALLHGLQANVMLYKNESFELIKILHSKGGFSEATERLAYQTRQLLNRTYSFLSPTQKNEIDKLILELVDHRDLTVYEEKGIKKHNLKYYGKTQFKYLKSVPRKEIDNRPLLKKRYQELERKFGAIHDEKPQGFVMRGISRPLNQNAYTNMDHEHWEETFYKYTKDFEPEFGSFRGSILEHSRAFKEEVKKRPDFFFALIENIIPKPQVPRNYVTSGLDGLVESKYDLNEVQRIYKKHIKTDLDETQTLFSIWVVDYFLENKSVDVEVLDFLIDCALNHNDPSDESVKHNPLTDGINTVRGAAGSRLVRIFFNQSYEEKIFNCLTKMTDDPSLVVRVSLLPRLALLMHQNEERTLQLFLKLVSKNEPEIIKHSFWSAQYLSNNYFDRLVPYFEHAIEIEDVHYDLSNILMQAWLKDKSEANELVNRLSKASHTAISTVIQSAAENLEYAPELKDKCILKLFAFLHYDDEKVADAYDHAFHHLPVDMFEELLQFLKKYARSAVARKAPQHFYEYLLKCAKTHPIECISLLSNFQKYDRPDISSGRYYDDEPIKVLIGAYNALSVEENSSHLRMAIKLFDKMLKDPRFRQEANRALSQVET